MPVNYPDEDQLAEAYRSKSSDWLREQLASGHLTQAAVAGVMVELQRRGEQPLSSGPPPPSDDDLVSEHRQDERVVQPRKPWPWWVWPVLFVVGLAYAMSQGINAKEPQDQSFLMGVIVLQALAMVLLVAAFRFTQRLRTVAGALGGLVLLAIPAVALFLLWLLSSIARHGFGG